MLKKARTNRILCSMRDYLGKGEFIYFLERKSTAHIVGLKQSHHIIFVNL
jgi:hypothetical protein